MNNNELIDQAKLVLKQNDLGDWTRPAPNLYPHQWLWDSCFTAIGVSNYDIKRAKREILSLLRGQWTNGMIPHMIFGEAQNYHAPPDLWRSKLSIYAPKDVETSGITQPPMLAEAIVRIGAKMKKSERITWYKKVWPYLLDYHEWLYRDRDLHAEGLVCLIHPWETGLDNTPPWIEAMHAHQKPLWIKMVEWSRADVFIEHLRRDTRQVPADERTTTIESLILYSVARRIRRKHFDTERIVLRSHFIIEDLFFNSILIRANTHVKAIAKEINEKIPRTTLSSMNRSTKALEELWDSETKQYYSRLFITRKLIMQPTIATLLPLYAGTITKKQATILVEHLKNPALFGTAYPVPTVPLTSSYYDPRRYWQGPSWVNTNWLIIDGLARYGFYEEAEQLKKTTLEMVMKSGCFEYFSSKDGQGAGIAPFSWTAALTIDLASNPLPKKKSS